MLSVAVVFLVILLFVTRMMLLVMMLFMMIVMFVTVIPWTREQLKVRFRCIFLALTHARDDGVCASCAHDVSCGVRGASFRRHELCLCGDDVSLLIQEGD